MNNPLLKDQPAARLREYIIKLFQEAELPTTHLHFHIYETHFPHEQGGLQDLYAVLIRCLGVLDLASVQVCRNRERLGPFCVLYRGQCASCLEYHDHQNCPVKMYVQNPGITMQAAIEACSYKGKNREKKAEFAARQRARSQSSSSGPVLVPPPGRAAYSQKEKFQKKKYAANRADPERDFRVCRLHSISKNAEKMEYRKTWDTDAGRFKWYPMCYHGTRCQATKLGQSQVADLVDELAEQFFREQEEERENRSRRRNINSGWVIENVAEWDLEYCKRHGKMPEL